MSTLRNYKNVVANIGLPVNVPQCPSYASAKFPDIGPLLQSQTNPVKKSNTPSCMYYLYKLTHTNNFCTSMLKPRNTVLLSAYGGCFLIILMVPLGLGGSQINSVLQ